MEENHLTKQFILFRQVKPTHFHGRKNFYYNPGICSVSIRACNYHNILRKTIEGYLDSIPSINIQYNIN